MIARIEDWKEAREKARGRAETDRALGEAHKLFHEISNMLTEMRWELLGCGRQQRCCGLPTARTTLRTGYVRVLVRWLRIQ